MDTDRTPDASNPLADLRARLVGERDKATAAAQAARNGDAARVHEGIAAGLDIAIRHLDAHTA